jgi:hypothetical protein
VFPRAAITAVLVGLAACAPADERQRMPPAALFSVPGAAEQEWDAVVAPAEISAFPTLADGPATETETGQAWDSAASPAESSAHPTVISEPTTVRETGPADPTEESADPHAYPAWNGVDLDCPDVGRRVRVTGSDPHRLDRDGDGWGCEKYGG